MTLLRVTEFKAICSGYLPGEVSTSVVVYLVAEDQDDLPTDVVGGSLGCVVAGSPLHRGLYWYDPAEAEWKKA